MKHFKNGDYVDIRDLDESVIKAIEARFVADGYEGFGVSPVETVGVADDEFWHSLCDDDKINQLTVEQCLFAGAPDWAVNVGKYGDKYFWTGGKYRYLCFDGVVNDPFIFNCSSHIYTRQKTEPRKTVEDATEHFNNVWPDESQEVICYTEGSDGYHVWCKGWYPIPTGKTYQVCTREQFNQHVKEKAVKWFKGVWSDSSEYVDAISFHGPTREFIRYNSACSYHLGRHVITYDEFKKIASELYPKADKNWHERGELPPVGEPVDYEGKRVEVIAHDTSKKYGNQFCARFKDGQIAILNSHWVKPIPKTKKINMSLFAGTGVLMTIKSTIGQCMHAEKINTLNGWFPLFGEWNHFEGDEMPAYLEGFEFEVRHVCTDLKLNRIDEICGDSSNSFSWGHVVEFKITGIKDGWTL